MAETLARSLIRLLVTVGILAAVYLFAIKPILDTTNDTIDKAFAPFNGIQQEIQDSFDQAGDSGFDANSINLNDSQKQAKKLLACIQRVQPNTDKMQACVERFQ